MDVYNSKDKRVCVHVPYNKLREHIDLIVDKKLNLEILFNANSLDNIREVDIFHLKEKLDYSPLITFHAPFIDLHPGSMDSLIRIATRERFDQILKISRLLNPSGIVFHPGVNKWAQDDYIQEKWLKDSIDFWRSFLKEAIKHNIRIAIENVFDDSPRYLSRLIKAVNSPSFGFCLDIGHFNLFSKVLLDEWFEDLKENIIEVHLHDNMGKEDDHLGIGEGEIDFDLLFSLLDRYNITPIYTIEGHSRESIEKSLINIKRYIN
ncbi:MAG: sugar phosphate isomerase/epimerase family protein [Nitrospirota bacterium]